MNTLSVASFVSGEYGIFISWWHLVLLRKLKCSCLAKYKCLGTVDCEDGDQHTRAAHSIPLDLTASITESTFLRRARTLALRVGDNFHGVFLAKAKIPGRERGKSITVMFQTHHSRPTEFTCVGLKAPPNMVTQPVLLDKLVVMKVYKSLRRQALQAKSIADSARAHFPNWFTEESGRSSGSPSSPLTVTIVHAIHASHKLRQSKWLQC